MVNVNWYEIRLREERLTQRGIRILLGKAVKREAIN